MKKFLLGALLCASAYAQTAGTVYQATIGGVAISGSPFPSLSAATLAETAAGPGTYTNTAFTTAAGTATTFVVAPVTSPNGTLVTAPGQTISALGVVWGLTTSQQVTVNGAVDTSTNKVGELAWESGTLWQESTNIGGNPLWWGTTVAPAKWLPANGTATSPIPVVVVPPPPPPPPPPPTGTSRPSYNTGNGLYVLNGQLYDANGVQFRIRGLDRTHYDSPSQPGLSKSGANAVRMFMYGLSVGAPKYVSILQTQHVAYKEVPIPSMPLFPDGTTTSGNQSTTELAAGVAWWVANASTFAPLSKSLIINVANEWGPSNSTVWRDSYITAISQLRAAGYLGPIMIDSGGWGQDTGDLFNYSTAVFNSDSQKNIIFSLHIYGAIPTASVAGDIAQLAALSKASGAVYVVGEFGPGRSIGPSPTTTTPGQIITACEANGIGWMAWAWDDNNEAGGASNDSSFSMTYHGPGTYTQPSDLTIYGTDVVLNSTYGLSVIAKPATTF